VLRKQAVTVGKCYVNNHRKVAREVLGVDYQTIKFYTYHLDTGNSCGLPSECTREDFLRWADREASPAEMISIQSQEMDAAFRAPQLPNPEEMEHDKVNDSVATTLTQKATTPR